MVLQYIGNVPNLKEIKMSSEYSNKIKNRKELILERDWQFNPTRIIKITIND